MAKKKTKPKKTDAQESFEESLAELETIVSDLEGGDLGLAEALERYEEGVGRLKSCHAQLEKAERRIELLSGVDSSGEPITEPFAEEGTSAADPSAKGRSKKRSAKGAGHGVDDRSRLF